MTLSKADLTLLDTLQKDAHYTNQDLAQKIGMSASPCWRRVKKFEEDGIIKGYKASLDRRKLGFGVMTFVRIALNSHSAKDADQFEQAVYELDHVIACYRVGGDDDFLMQVVAENMDAYAHFAMTQIRQLPFVKEMHSLFVLDELKPLESLPVYTLLNK